MPACRLSDQPVSVGKFDVVGQDSETVPQFVRHVGLCGGGRAVLTPDDHIPLVHMGPPLVRSDGPIQSVGSAELTVDEINEISVFVDERISEYEADRRRGPFQYVVHPHASDVRAADGTVICTRFSCVGFVLECYSAVEISVLSTDEAMLPPVDVDTLSTAYPDLESRLRNPAKRKLYGLHGDGPWPALLAGYLFNSLRRSVEEIRAEPFVPQAGDEYFPTAHSTA